MAKPAVALCLLSPGSERHRCVHAHSTKQHVKASILNEQPLINPLYDGVT